MPYDVELRELRQAVIIAEKIGRQACLGNIRRRNINANAPGCA
jgi:hypothetical protein